MNHVKEEKSLGALFSDLSQEMQRLIRDELTLFKSEMSYKVKRGGKTSPSSQSARLFSMQVC